MDEYGFVIETGVAGLLASVACGLGVFPLLFRSIQFEKRIGLGYGFAGGLMFSASVYNLLLPAFSLESNGRPDPSQLIRTLIGMGLGCTFLWGVSRYLTPERLQSKFLRPFGGRVETLIFLAMCFHSIPEGIAVGVGYASESRLTSAEGLGGYIALAIGIHNMPEGLAIGLPMRARGASIFRCAFFAFLTSLPQPIAGVFASLLVWFFEPLMVPSLGLAAGAMMYLVIVELVPDGMETSSRTQVAWSFMVGFGLMALIQVTFG